MTTWSSRLWIDQAQEPQGNEEGKELGAEGKDEEMKGFVLVIRVHHTRRDFQSRSVARGRR